ncbi:MAG: hypothetical protein ACOH1N_07750 [Lutibacter sp.]
MGHFPDNRKEWTSLSHPFSHSKIAQTEMVISDEKENKVMKNIH